MTYEALQALAVSSHSRTINLFDRERCHHAFLSDQAGQTSAERLQSYIEMHHLHHDEHPRWLRYLEELAIHGANTKLPWKREHGPAHPGREPPPIRSPQASAACSAYGEAAWTVGHTMIVRAATKFAATQLLVIHQTLSETRGKNLSTKDKFGIFKKALADRSESFGKSFEHLLSASVGAVGIEIFHRLLHYFESCWLSFVRAVRCSTNTIIDTAYDFVSGTLTPNERLAILVKGACATGIIVGSELLHQAISLQLEPFIPPFLMGQKDFLVHTIITIGVLLAMYATDKLVDAAFQVKSARRKADIARACSRITGREINEHRARVHRMASAGAEASLHA